MDSQFSHLAWCQTGAHLLSLILYLQAEVCMHARDYAQAQKDSSQRSHVKLYLVMSLHGIPAAL